MFQLDYGSLHNVCFLLASAQNKIHILSYNPNVANSVMFGNFGSITLFSLSVFLMGLGKVPMFVFPGFFMTFSLCALKKTGFGAALETTQKTE